jgi:hypothetical protein
MNNTSKDAHSEVKRMAELKCERVFGKCEVCGAEGEISRFSRPIEGYIWYSKDGTFTFKRGAVQQICNSCFARGIANLLDVSDARSRAVILKSLELVLRKHGYQLVRKGAEKREKPNEPSSSQRS